jgi:hypothetical protein
VRRDVVLPLVGERLNRRGLHEVAPVHAVGIAVPGNVCLCHPKDAYDLRCDAGLLPCFSYRCLFDRLAVVDPTSGDDSRELRLVGGVVDE